MRRPRQFLGLVPVALLPPAAFAVHQLRYLLAYGSAAGIELQRTGHSYLHSIVPWIIVLIALAVGLFLRALGQRVRRPVLGPAVRRFVPGSLAVCAASLVAIYAARSSWRGARDRSSGGARRRVRLRRLVGDPGSGVHRARPRRGVPRRNVGPARGDSPLRLPAARRAPTASRPEHVTLQVFVPRLAPLVGGWSGAALPDEPCGVRLLVRRAPT